MRYKVLITPRALEDLRAAYHWIASRSPERAVAWYEGFIAAIDSLAMHPLRCGIALENGSMPAELRQLIYGKRGGRYRAIFSIKENVVRVLHIRHAAQTPVPPDELHDK
jgi:plasmid stabilization system protein ParE